MDVNTQLKTQTGGVANKGGVALSRGSSTTIKEQHVELEKVDQKNSRNELKKELRHITKELNKEMSSLNSSLKFGFNEKADYFYVSVVDSNTNKEIRKFPTDEALELMTKMRELVGQIFDTKG